VQTLLRQTSKVKVLVTSRQRLNLTSEYTYPLPGMSVPVIGDDTPELLRNECVQLFLDAAQRASPAYQPAERDLQAIALLCRQVQGVPLAILLAAAWVDLLSPDEIAAEVSRSLDFLSVDWQDQPARQRSLRATFDYTWSLLAESERQVFQALSVFRGSFTYPAAQQIAGATVQGLRLLVDKSVVQRLEGGRYQVHELLSQFAAEKLAQAQESRHAAMERHSRFYAGSFKAWGHGLRGAHMPEARLEMDAEAGNLRQAWEWAAESGNLAHLAQMMDGLFLHYNFSGDCNEAESACRCALQALQERGEAQASRLKAFLLARLATANFSLKRNDQNPALLQASQAELDRAQAAGLDVRLEQAFLRYVQARDCAATDRETAYRLLAESAELFRPVDAWRQWMALNVLGNRYHLSGDLPAAERWLNEALVVARQIGQPISLASTLNELGFVRARQGVVAEGLRLVEESAEILVASGLQPNVVQGKFQMGLMLLWNGRFAEGRAQIEQCLPLLREPGDRYLCGYVTMCLGLAELNLCDNAPARRHLTEGLQQARQGGYRRDIGFAALGLGMLALAEGDLPAAGAFLQESLAAYPQEQLPDEYGAALGIQALVCRAAGEPAGAWAALEQGLQIVKRMHGLYAAGTCALAAAMLLAERGQARRAVELAHLAFRQPLFGNSSWYRQVIGDPLARLENSLPPEEAEATRQRAAAGDLLQALDALLEPSQQPVMAAV
jgi:predicted ATPase